jgi:hypothetical protein
MLCCGNSQGVHTLKINFNTNFPYTIRMFRMIRYWDNVLLKMAFLLAAAALRSWNSKGVRQRLRLSKSCEGS